MPNGNIRVNLLAMKGAPTKFIYPAEGAGAWIAYLNIPKGARNRDLALKLMNYMLRPDIQTKIALNVRTSPINTKSVLPADEAQGITQGDDLKSLRPLRWDLVVPRLNELHDRWNKDFQN